MSRIHLQIGYEPLDDAARLLIWNNSFKKLLANHKQGGREIHYSITAKEYVKKSETLQQLKWNGREIRNGELRRNRIRLSSASDVLTLVRITQLSRLPLLLLLLRPSKVVKAFRPSRKTTSAAWLICQSRLRST